MEAMRTIVSALAEGARAVGGDPGGRAVTEEYQGLKRLIAERFEEAAEAEKALAVVENQPGALRHPAPLEDRLKAVGADADPRIVAQAEVLLELLRQSQAQTGGIHARTIKAQNVVDGAQFQGGMPDDAADLLRLSKEIARGGIHADHIDAQSLVSGLQYIADPKTATPEQLRQEVAALRESAQTAIQAGEIQNQGDAQDLDESLEKAQNELASPTPQGSRVVRALKTTTEILNQTADTLKAGGKVQTQAMKLAPTAAAVYSVAQLLFG